ncbi:MAG: hypothetical protein RLZ98_2697 [Pseudomonadota bacterium]
MRRSLGPTGSYLDMLLVDHGIFRLAYLNLHQIDDNCWRSAQPAPHQLRAIARRGIRTIVNLRGERLCGGFWLEQKACEQIGLKLVNFPIRSRAAPTPKEFHAARELFETVEYPILMHCKSGADRAGLMSVLYRFMKRGEPLEASLEELSLRYGHIRQADTGVLDYVFHLYLAHNQVTPMPFLQWVDTVYDPEKAKATFVAEGWANRLVNTVLRRE